MMMMMMTVILKNRRERRAMYFQKKTFTLNTFAFKSINLHGDNDQDNDNDTDDDVGDENPPFSICTGKNLGKAGGLGDIFH